MTTLPSPDPASTSPQHWLDEHGDALYRYAYFRLRDAAQAEDLVQETLLAAWQARHGFSGRSSERTWLIGILKNKLVDYLRKYSRERPFGALTDTDADVDALFEDDADQHWKASPLDWGNPANALHQKQFWKVFVQCIDTLPPRQAQVFSLCELDELDNDEACKVLDVAPTNLWVMLHRARLRLRQCLEVNWFGHAGEK